MLSQRKSIARRCEDSKSLGAPSSILQREHIANKSHQLTEDLNVKLADFGMSGPVSAIHSGIALGTATYNAPELLQTPTPSLSLAIDVYSCGVMLHVLLTGKEPFHNVRPVEQMVWVARGGYWEWQEQRKWRELSKGSDIDLGTSRSRPSSVYSFHSTHSVESFESASSIASNLSTRGPTRALVASLLEDEHTTPNSVSHAALPVNSLHDVEDDESNAVVAAEPDLSTAGARSYTDGSPMQYFLSGREPVPEGISTSKALRARAVPS